MVPVLSTSSPSKLHRNSKVVSPKDSPMPVRQSSLTKRIRYEPPSHSHTTSGNTFEELFDPLKLLPSTEKTSYIEGRTVYIPVVKSSCDSSPSSASASSSVSPNSPDDNPLLDGPTISGQEAMGLNFYGSINTNSSNERSSTGRKRSLSDNQEENFLANSPIPTNSSNRDIAAPVDEFNSLTSSSDYGCSVEVSNSTPVQLNDFPSSLNHADLFDPVLLYFPRDQKPELFQYPTRPSYLKEALTNNLYIPSYTLESSHKRIANYYSKMKKYYCRPNRILPFFPSKLSTVTYPQNDYTNSRHGYSPRNFSSIELIRFIQSFPYKQGPSASEVVNAFLPFIQPPNATIVEHKANFQIFKHTLNSVAEYGAHKKIYVKKA